MARGVITLITDFGLSDHYAGVVKGVILGIHAKAQIVDLSHQVEPYDVLGACLTLAASYAYFPPNTVHLVVVDPGVGGARRPLAVEAGSWWFVAPDNGVLELVYRQHPHRVWALRPEEFALKPISNTFHGRDIFAPAAALLAKGVRPGRHGDRIDDYQRLEIPRLQQKAPGRWSGQVLKVDRFGSLITNFPAGQLPARFEIHVGRIRIRTLRLSYASAPPREVFAIAGSSGYLEISVNQGSAAESTGVKAGAAVTIVDTGAGE